MAFHLREPYIHNPKLKGLLRRVKVPTRFVWGDSDGSAMPKYGRRSTNSSPGAAFDLIDRVGHAPQIEQPEVSVAQVLARAMASDRN